MNSLRHLLAPPGELKNGCSPHAILNMECCLLCLENCQEIFDCVQVNSEKFNTQNMKYLIEKHLWPMETINGSSLLCVTCGRELYDFHKFYMRIRQAHKKLDILVKTKGEEQSMDSNVCQNNFACKEIFNKNYHIDSNVEPEIVMEEIMSTDIDLDVPLIKTEENSVMCQQEVSLKPNLIKGIILASKISDKDPLENVKMCKQTKNSLKKKSKQNINKSKTNAEKHDLIISEELEEQTDIKHKPEDLESSIKTTDVECNIEDQYIDSDSNEQGEILTAKSNKNKRRNPDEKTLKEYDRVIAENFQIVCSICQISFENFLSLRRHFKAVHKQRGYARCCKRNFFTRSVLVDHIHVHLNPEHFKCQECGKIFSDRSTLVCHTKLHEDNSKLEKCDKCGKVFVNSGALKTHLLTHSSEKMFPCTICGKFFTNSSILNHHIEAVHQHKFVQICDICGKAIRCPTAFASHLENHKVKTIHISCDICGLLLSNKEGLKRHKNSQHPEGGKKEHKCHICLKISPTIRALKSHIQRTHEMGYDYKCSLCEKAFKRPAVLREHMATHTGTALYSCPWCTKTFISNGNMYNHRKNAHPKEWEELQRQKYVEK